MKSMLQYLILAGLLSFLPAAGLLAAENIDAEQQPAKAEKHFEAMAARLSLTAEQQEQIKNLRQNQRRQMKELLRELQAKRQQIKDELNNPDATRESIAPLAAEIKTLFTKMVDQRIDSVFAVKGLLTPEQFNKLQQFRQNREGDRKSHRQPWFEKKCAKGMKNKDKEPAEDDINE